MKTVFDLQLFLRRTGLIATIVGLIVVVYIYEDQMLTEHESAEKNTFLAGKSLECSSRTQREKYTELGAHARTLLSEKSIVQRTANCDDYFKLMPTSFQVHRQGFTSKSESTPLAFSHGVHKQIGILEIFLLQYFRPWNHHCIHVDKQAGSLIHAAVSALVSCYKAKFPNANIFIAKNNIPVYWGHISVVDADLICLRQLLAGGSHWKFYLNLAGTELPLVPYDDLVRRIASNNRSIVSSKPVPKEHLSRFQHGIILDRKSQSVRKSKRKLSAPPNGLKMFKGYKNVVLTREFAKFVVYDNASLIFHSWAKDTFVPDESFFATLVRLHRSNRDGTPVYIQDTKSLSTEYNGNICIRYSVWFDPFHPELHTHRSCQGEVERHICQLSVPDLDEAFKSGCLIANKVNLNVDAVAPLCLFQSLHQRETERL